MVGARPRFRVRIGGGRAAGGRGSGSRRGARSGLGSLAGSVARPAAPAPRLLSVFRSAWLRQSKGKARQKPSLCEYP